MKKLIAFLLVLAVAFVCVFGIKEKIECEYCGKTKVGKGITASFENKNILFCDDCYETIVKNANPYKNPNFKDFNADENLVENPMRFSELKELNPDICAWIQIEGMETIDYPILQSAPESEEDFYLTHDQNGEVKREGSIYIQKLNSSDFSDSNTIIYGHNMRSGTMFGQLKNFRDKEFFDEHRNIYIYTPNQILQYEIISAFVYDSRHILYSFNNFFDEKSRMEFFDTCVNPKAFTKQVVEGAELSADDKIITLSTCTSNNSERYLVIGKLIKTAKTKPS